VHDNNCPWDEETCQSAAKYGNLDCLKYAIGNGCQYNLKKLKKITKSKKIKEYLHIL